MGTVLFIVGAILLFYFSWHLNRKSSEKTTMSAQEIEKEEERILMNTKKKVVRALRNLECRPKENSEGSMDFSYQGENFHLDFSGYGVRIWDLCWAGMNTSDVNFPKLQQAVNLTNFDLGPTLLLTMPNKDGDVALHTRYDLMISSDFDDTENYLTISLARCFQIKEQLRQKFNELLTTQRDASKKRNSIGFNTNCDAENQKESGEEKKSENN